MKTFGPGTLPGSRGSALTPRLRLLAPQGRSPRLGPRVRTDRPRGDSWRELPLLGASACSPSRGELGGSDPDGESRRCKRVLRRRALDTPPGYSRPEKTTSVRGSDPRSCRVDRGRDVVIRWWREWLVAWDTFDFDYEFVEHQCLDEKWNQVGPIPDGTRGRLRPGDPSACAFVKAWSQGNEARFCMSPLSSVVSNAVAQRRSRGSLSGGARRPRRRCCWCRCWPRSCRRSCGSSRPWSGPRRGRCGGS